MPAVGIGTTLVHKEWVQARGFGAITAKTAEVIAWIRPFGVNRGQSSTSAGYSSENALICERREYRDVSGEDEIVSH